MQECARSPCPVGTSNILRLTSFTELELEDEVGIETYTGHMRVRIRGTGHAYGWCPVVVAADAWHIDAPA